MPAIPILHHALFEILWCIRQILSNFIRIFWTTPLFQTRLKQHSKGLYLYGGIPLILGPLDITIGSNSRISGKTTFSGRASLHAKAQLIIGKNCDIGWQSTIAVGKNIIIEDNVRLAGQVFLAGYPGHPIEATERAAGLPCHDEQARDIILRRDVWLGTGVTILAGVTIGQGTIIAASSTVTKDIPPFVLAAGNPARIIKSLDTLQKSENNHAP